LNKAIRYKAKARHGKAKAAGGKAKAKPRPKNLALRPRPNVSEYFGHILMLPSQTMIDT